MTHLRACFLTTETAENKITTLFSVLLLKFCNYYQNTDSKPCPCGWSVTQYNRIRRYVERVYRMVNDYFDHITLSDLMGQNIRSDRAERISEKTD